MLNVKINDWKKIILCVTLVIGMANICRSVDCRYLRIDSFFCPRMEYSEIEVISDGENIIKKRPDRIVGGALRVWTVWKSQ